MLDNFKEEVIVKRNRGLNSLMYGIELGVHRDIRSVRAA